MTQQKNGEVCAKACKLVHEEWMKTVSACVFQGTGKVSKTDGLARCVVCRKMNARRWIEELVCQKALQCSTCECGVGLRLQTCEASAVLRL